MELKPVTRTQLDVFTDWVHAIQESTGNGVESAIRVVSEDAVTIGIPEIVVARMASQFRAEHSL